VDTASGQTAATPPYREIKAGSTTLGDPIGISIDAFHDEMYIANRDTNAVLIFGPITSLTTGAAPLRQVLGAATTISTPIGVVYHREKDTIYQLNDSATAVKVFSPGATATGNVAPARTFTSASFQFVNDIALDTAR